MPDSAFDAWYNEIEGFALRAERLTGPKAELMAAFEAGVEAERERCAKVCEQQAQEFLSPQYASNQPLGSLTERFACDECASAIRNPPEQPGQL